MDRATVYTQEQGRSVDFLFAQRATMIGLGKLAQAIMGGNTMVRGLPVSPNSPAALNVLVGIGEIYSLVQVDATAWGALPADTTDFIVKQGLNMAAQTIATPAPTTGGYSIAYLIEAQYQDQDTNPAVLPFYNSANPQIPLNGQGGSGAAQATERQGVCVVQAKAGIAAPTGTQVTPTVDTGWTALAVVTVAFGQTTVVSGNITVPAGVPQITNVLQMMQTESTNYALDTSTTANQITIALTPPITSYTDGMQLNFRAANNSSNAVNINAGPGNISLSGAAGALQSGEIVAGGYYTAVYQSNTGTAVLVGQGAGAEQINAATQPKHAVQLAQIGSVNGSGIKLNGTNNPNLLFNSSGEFGATGWTLGSFSQFVDTSGEIGNFFSNSGALAAYTFAVAGQQVSIGPSQNVCLSMDVSNGASGTVQISLAAYTSGGSYISNIGTLAVPNSSLTRYSTTAATPANTAYVVPQLVLNGVTSTAFGIVFRRVKVEQGNAPSLYSQEASIAAVNTGRLLHVTVYTKIAGVQNVSVDGGAFTTTGATTFTASAFTNSVITEVQGAGGGGGGSANATGTTVSIGSGGGAGAYGKTRITSGFSGVTVTVGSGGTAGAVGGSGGSGGTSSFGSILSAIGGGGGTAGPVGTPPYSQPGGVGGNAPITANLINARGGDGIFSSAGSTGSFVSGTGALSLFGAGGTALGSTTSAGVAAVSYGTGGGGAASGSSTSGQTGGAGAPGVIVVYEYA